MMEENRFNFAILDFLDHIRSEKGLSSHTVEAYGRDIRSFAAFLAEKDWTKVDSAAILFFSPFAK